MATIPLFIIGMTTTFLRCFPPPDATACDGSAFKPSPQCSTGVLKVLAVFRISGSCSGAETCCSDPRIACEGRVPRKSLMHRRLVEQCDGKPSCPDVVAPTGLRRMKCNSNGSLSGFWRVVYTCEQDPVAQQRDLYRSSSQFSPSTPHMLGLTPPSQRSSSDTTEKPDLDDWSLNLDKDYDRTELLDDDNGLDSIDYLSQNDSDEIKSLFLGLNVNNSATGRSSTTTLSSAGSDENSTTAALAPWTEKKPKRSVLGKKGLLISFLKHNVIIFISVLLQSSFTSFLPSIPPFIHSFHSFL